MPYIDKQIRPVFDNQIEDLSRLIKTPGELTYVLYRLCIGYPANHSGRKYQFFAEIAGALMNTYQEFYRRIIAPYEDEKIRENGDV
jgi:hypothetical protein